MFSKKLNKISIDKKLQNKTDVYNVKGGWEKSNNDVKEFKKTLIEKIKINQDNRCVYCELGLDTRGLEIEHIAPKFKYTQVIYNPLNLAGACHSCNSSSHKGCVDIVVDSSDSDYSKWKFSIVHPYLDNPKEYYEYDKPVICYIKIKDGLNDSDRKKAENTIEMFELNSCAMIEERKKDRLYETIDPNELDRILKISSYGIR